MCLLELQQKRDFILASQRRRFSRAATLGEKDVKTFFRGNLNLNLSAKSTEFENLQLIHYFNLCKLNKSCLLSTSANPCKT